MWSRIWQIEEKFITFTSGLTMQDAIKALITSMPYIKNSNPSSSHTTFVKRKMERVHVTEKHRILNLPLKDMSVKEMMSWMLLK